MTARPRTKSFGKQPGDEQRSGDAQQDNQCQKQAGSDSAAKGKGSGKKHGNNGNQGGKTPIAGDKAVSQNRDEAFPGRLNDSASGYAAGVAAKAHAHCRLIFECEINHK